MESFEGVGILEISARLDTLLERERIRQVAQDRATTGRYFQF